MTVPYGDLKVAHRGVMYEGRWEREGYGIRVSYNGTSKWAACGPEKPQMLASMLLHELIDKI